MRKLRKNVCIVLLFGLLVYQAFSVANVFAQPAISITITPIDDTMQGLDHEATFKITTTNNAPSVERHVLLTLEVPILPPGGTWLGPPPTAYVLPSGWTYSISPNEFDIDEGQSIESTLVITGSVSTSPGDYPFRVIGYWSVDSDDGARAPEDYEWTSDSDDVSVLSILVIPEFPLGTIAALVTCIAALAISKARATRNSP